MAYLRRGVREGSVARSEVSEREWCLSPQHPHQAPEPACRLPRECRGEIGPRRSLDTRSNLDRSRLRGDDGRPEFDRTASARRGAWWRPSNERIFGSTWVYARRRPLPPRGLPSSAHGRQAGTANSCSIEQTQASGGVCRTHRRALWDSGERRTAPNRHTAARVIAGGRTTLAFFYARLIDSPVTTNTHIQAGDHGSQLGRQGGGQPAGGGRRDQVRWV